MINVFLLFLGMTEDQHCIEHDDSVYGAEDLGGFEFLAYKDPPPPYSSPPGTLNRHYDPPPYETATGLGETSTDTQQDPNRVHVAGASSPQTTSTDSHVQRRELPCDVHISQTRMWILKVNIRFWCGCVKEINCCFPLNCNSVQYSKWPGRFLHA